MKKEPQIICVPPGLFSEVWGYYGGFLLRGLAEATDVGCIETIERIKRGEHLFWVIARGKTRLGAFVTQICDDGGVRFVGIYGLAGIEAKSWIAAVNARMARYAAEEKCAAYRFCGRRAWERLLPDCSVVGSRQGSQVYQGAPAP